MHSTSSRVRASSLAAILVLTPAWGVFAGPLRGQQAGGMRHLTSQQRSGHNPQQAAAMHQQAMARQQQQGAMMHNQNGAHHMNNQSNQANGPMVSALHSTMTLLTQADHDYQGHRARAMQEIHTAIRHLNPQAAQSQMGNNGLGQSGGGQGLRNRTGNGTGTGTGTATTTGNGTRTGNGTGAGNTQRMPQATSDGHLRQAHQSLLAIESQMSNNGGKGQQHHALARASVQKAIRELSTALTIK